MNRWGRTKQTEVFQLRRGGETPKAAREPRAGDGAHKPEPQAAGQRISPRA